MQRAASSPGIFEDGLSPTALEEHAPAVLPSSLHKIDCEASALYTRDCVMERGSLLSIKTLLSSSGSQQLRDVSYRRREGTGRMHLCATVRQACHGLHIIVCQPLTIWFRLLIFSFWLALVFTSDNPVSHAIYICHLPTGGLCTRCISVPIC